MNYIVQEFDITITRGNYIGRYIDSYSNDGNKREYYTESDARFAAKSIVMSDKNAIVRIVKVIDYEIGTDMWCVDVIVDGEQTYLHDDTREQASGDYDRVVHIAATALDYRTGQECTVRLIHKGDVVASATIVDGEILDSFDHRWRKGEPVSMTGRW